VKDPQDRTEKSSSESNKSFRYSDYSSGVRLATEESRESSRKQLAWFVRHFKGCNKVLDVACGEGLFLDLLSEAGIPAVGVDADSGAVRSSISRGHNVVEQDVIEYLNSTTDRFNGVFCSHLIEHLPFDVVLRLIDGVSNCILREGIFVLAFPNPRSLRAHLQQFWVDPQHVRFYDGSLIRGVLEHRGFQVISDSNDLYDDGNAHRIAPRGLVKAAAEMEAPRRETGKMAWLASSNTGSGVRQGAKSRLLGWIRHRLGISILANETIVLKKEIARLNQVLARTVHLIDDFDIEERLVSRKLA
jgi:SAM-dependent methyltransferase